jgi:hypothetical protein
MKIDTKLKAQEYDFTVIRAGRKRLRLYFVPCDADYTAIPPGSAAIICTPEFDRNTITCMDDLNTLGEGDPVSRGILGVYWG